MPVHSARLTIKMLPIRFKEEQKEWAYKLRLVQGSELFAQVNTKNNIGFGNSWLEICDRIDGKHEEVLTSYETIAMFEQLKGGGSS